jgi:thiosulfate/3-mercaptopyruvate sulfurtransferase
MAVDTVPVVSVRWLQEHIASPGLVILDASWYLPSDKRDCRAEFEKAHIPGALFFDIDALVDSSSDLPHMLPPPDEFTTAMRKLGLNGDDRVVVYDSAGLFSAPRAWWMLRLFGHRDVVVLDGGLPKWFAEGRATEDVAPVARERHFTARRNAALVRDVTQMAMAAKLGAEQIVDARSAPRFRGEAPEPRAGLRSGHIPGAVNLPYGALLNPDSTLKDPDALRAAFVAAGVDLSKPVVSSCGSGITACVLDLALERIGHRRHAVYDGSWAEWGMYRDLKVET